MSRPVQNQTRSCFFACSRNLIRPAALAGRPIRRSCRLMARAWGFRRLPRRGDRRRPSDSGQTRRRAETRISVKATSLVSYEVGRTRWCRVGDRDPGGQLVAEIIAVIVDASVLAEQTARVVARPAVEPAERRARRQRLVSMRAPGGCARAPSSRRFRDSRANGSHGKRSRDPPPERPGSIQGIAAERRATPRMLTFTPKRSKMRNKRQLAAARAVFERRLDG